MSSGNGFVVVMNQQAVVPLTIGTANILKVAFEARNELLKGLFIQRSSSEERVKVNLVNAFSEQAGKAPTRNTIGNIIDEALPFRQGKVNVWVSLCVVLFGLPVGLSSVLSLELKQMCRPRTDDCGATLIAGKLLEVGYA